MRRVLALALLTCTTAALAAASNPDLDKAAEAIADTKYPEALKLLDTIAKSPKLDRDTVLRSYELRGIAQALNKQEAKSKLAFEALLWLQPEYQLPAKSDARVAKVFKAARDWARANPGLEFRAEPAATDDRGRVMQVAAYLKADPLKMVKKVRFHLRADGRGWSEVEEQVQSSYAATATEADGVEWWAELLGDKSAVLARLGSEAQPVQEGKAKPEKKAPPKKEPVVARTEPAPKKEEPAGEEKKPGDAPVAENSGGETTHEAEASVTQTPGKPFKMTAVRGLGVGLAGVGVVAGVVGVILGGVSAGARSQLNAAQPNANGLITTLTQKQAFELEASANGTAAGANVLYVTAGVMAAAGVVMIIAGGDSGDATVTLAPAGAGVLLSGTLP